MKNWMSSDKVEMRKFTLSSKFIAPIGAVSEEPGEK